jgi:ubiquinone/menaquinone biosynthesis C-methylase UbiE
MEPEYRDFRHLEHTGWERVAGEYETRWTDLTSHFIDPLLRAVELSAGARLLDVACGPGYVAAAALSAGAVPVGIDFSANMIRRARERNPGIEFQEGNAERLPFEAARFDRVVTNFGVPHLPRPEVAFREARRVLRRGGRFGFTVWAAPQDNPMARYVGEAIEAHADLGLDLAEEPPRFPLCEEQACRRTLEEAGFAPASTTFESVRATWRVPSAEFLFESEIKGGVRTAAVLARQSAGRLVAIRAAIADAVRAHAVPGGFAIPTTAHVVAAVAAS